MINVYWIIKRARTTARFCGSVASNSQGRIKCVSLNNRSCQARPILTNINSNVTFDYSFNKLCQFGGSYNTIDHSYARICVQNKVKK